MIKNIVNKLLTNINPNIDTSKLHELYTQPVKEHNKDTPSFQTFQEGIYGQADLLYLPHNYGYKYLLVYVDNHSKKCDAEPLKDRNAGTVVKAFMKIFERKIIIKPKVITTDAGCEFKASCTKYFKDNKIHHIIAPTGRHRMVALVERKNQIIGTILHQIMAQQELTLGRVNKTWVKYLKDLINEINKNLPTPLKEAKSIDPVHTKNNEVILPIDTKVRVKLDVPLDVATGKRLIGTFRASDVKWSKDIKEVKQIILKPSQPPLYLVNGIHHAFTTQQLLPTRFV